LRHFGAAAGPGPKNDFQKEPTMAVRVTRDARVYHSPTSQFHDLTKDQEIVGDFANYLEQNAPDVVEPFGDGGDFGVTDPIDGLVPVSLENRLQRAGAATFTPDRSLPPGTPDPVQLARDGRSAMAQTVPVTVSVDPAGNSIPGGGNNVEARTRVEGMPPAGSNIVAGEGGSGIVVVPHDATKAVLVEPATGSVFSQAGPLIEGGLAYDPTGPNDADHLDVEVADPDQPVEKPAGEDGEDEADAGEGEFDPAKHNAADVLAYVKRNPDQRQRILALERDGKARTSVLSALSS
jgi:hypothetical protein